MSGQVLMRKFEQSNAARIVDVCEQKLKASGFLHRQATTLWRHTNLKFDVLKFDVFPRARCEKWRVPFGSFGLQPSCLFPFLPRLGHTPQDSVRPEAGFGQVRLSINRTISQPSVRAANVWWAGDEETIFESVLKDLLNKVSEEVLPFFGRFEDTAELLRTFVEDDDAIGREGVWDFGKKGSPTRLLYTGFAAIECGKWDLATSSLEECREKAMTVAEPIGGRVRAEMLPYINQGIVCAEQRRSWSP
jgi:hypothetical protein